MVGWLPGGSAGTSFCSGTEISISLRAMVCPRCLFLFVESLSVLPHDPVLQDADFLDFELDRVAMFEEPAELESAAIAHRARTDEFTRHQRLVLRDMGDDLLEREQHPIRDAG